MTHEDEHARADAKVFSEDEYRADPRKVIAHAVATGQAVVAGADGTPSVVIAIPPAEAAGFDPLA
ncbi:MAG: hypothetical protein KF773_29620 [Deltaproteobacteria bacterium]|nr:hypothetical protein [Deltaproteobacteria bacterium]